MKRTACVAIILIFCFTTCLFAQNLPTAKPEDVGMSSERLKRINPVMQKYVDDGKLPGMLTLVARQGKVVHLETFGKMDLAKNKPLKEETIFRIYSMSKPVTSIAMMLLYEEARFNLDDPVSKYIPEFKDLKVFNRMSGDSMVVDDLENKMTIRHLFTHTSGLTYGWGGRPVDSLYWEENIFEPGSTLKQMIEKLGRIPLVFQPGTKYEYSVSTDVLGYLVEVISGMPFEQFLKKRLFQPLDMVDTGFFVPEEKRHRYAELYRHNKKTGKMEVPEDIPLGDGPHKFFPSGGGGLVSTTHDYLRFCQMLLNGGELDGIRILGKKTVELIRMNHLPDDVKLWGGTSHGWGLGFAVVLDMAKSGELASEGTYSWGGAAATNFWIDPEENLIGIFMTQLLNNPHPFHGEFRRLTYSSIVD